MLTVSDQAALVIDGILNARKLPQEAGVRISTEIGDSNGSTPGLGVRMDLVDAPQADDEVLEEAAVFLEPEAAMLLDDKLLDAELAGERVRFAVKERD
jgi:iron-sulfur cluster assembly protein